MPDAAPIGSDTCTYLGVDGFGDMQIEIQFTSDLTEQDDAYVNYSVFNGDTMIAVSDAYVEDLAPGERVRMNFDTVEQAPSDDSGVTCVYRGVMPFGENGQTVRPVAGDECVFVELDPVGDIQVRLDVADPFGADAGTIAIDYALRSPDGTRFGDGVAFTEATDQARIMAGADTVTKTPAWLTPTEISCEVLALVSFN